MNKPRKNKLSAEQLLVIWERIYSTGTRKIIEEKQSEEVKEYYLAKAKEKRNRKNNKRLIIFK